MGWVKVMRWGTQCVSFGTFLDNIASHHAVWVSWLQCIARDESFDCHALQVLCNQVLVAVFVLFVCVGVCAMGR